MYAPLYLKHVIRNQLCAYQRTKGMRKNVKNAKKVEKKYVRTVNIH